MERRESIRHPQNFPPRVNTIFCTYPQTDRVSRIFQVSQDLFDSFDSFHLFRNFQFSCDSLPRNPSFLPPAEDKKWRWLINGSAREEPSSGFQLRDVKTRLSPRSSREKGSPSRSFPACPSTAGHESRGGGPKTPLSPSLLSGCFVPSVLAAQCDIYGFLLGACAEAAIIPAANPLPSPSDPPPPCTLFSDGHSILSLSFSAVSPQLF